MVQTTVVLGLLAGILMLINAKTTGQQWKGVQVGLKQMLQTVPLLVAAFILGGMIEVLVPAEFVEQWLSAQAGLRGILLGTLGGMILAMGPYAAFPIVGSILAAGGGLGTLVALLTSWGISALNKAPFEIGFMGARFFAYKFVFSIPFCVAAGLLAHFLEVAVL
ncbi:MAG: permease [Limnochordia bacterium]|jgi:uncharacterized membrane protein YraQ (UPF0718 family)|nr:permease [Bacillota bacterium]